MTLNYINIQFLKYGRQKKRSGGYPPDLIIWLIATRVFLFTSLPSPYANIIISRAQTFVNNFKGVFNKFFKAGSNVCKTKRVELNYSHMSPTSVSIENITPFGIWLFVKDKEYFLDYDNYPYFKEHALGSIQNVKLLHDFHLYWTELDIDLELDNLENPEKYPLKFK